MVRVELVVKGSKADLVIKGESIDEVVGEYQAMDLKVRNILGAIPEEKAGAERKIPAGTLQGRILNLRSEGFFNTPKTVGMVRKDLKTKGIHYSLDRISIALLRLVRKKELRRLAELVEGKEVYKYVIR
jgi:hypothetical protein